MASNSSQTSNAASKSSSLSNLWNTAVSALKKRSKRGDSFNNANSEAATAPGSETRDHASPEASNPHSEGARGDRENGRAATKQETGWQSSESFNCSGYQPYGHGGYGSGGRSQSFSRLPVYTTYLNGDTYESREFGGMRVDNFKEPDEASLGTEMKDPTADGTIWEVRTFQGMEHWIEHPPRPDSGLG